MNSNIHRKSFWLSYLNEYYYRYALDVNIERAEDVLMHKKLLHLAHDPDNRPAVEVRLVQVSPFDLFREKKVVSKMNLFYFQYVLTLKIDYRDLFYSKVFLLPCRYTCNLPKNIVFSWG